MKATAFASVCRIAPVWVLGLLCAGAAWSAPQLRLSETTVGPVSVAVGANGPTRSIDATNSGDGTLNLSLRSSAPWLVSTLGTPRNCAIFGSTGGTCTPIQFALNTSALAKGTYTGVVTVSDPNAVDAPQTVTVTVQVGGAVPDSATLFVSTQAGSTASVPFVTNSQIQGTPTTQTGGNWLSLAFDGSSSFSFTLPYAIRVTNPGNLAVGSYTGSLAIAGSSVAADNKTVPVTLRVTAEPIARLSPSSIRQRLAQTGPKLISYVNVTNGGMGTLTLADPSVTTGGSGGAWLTAARVAGTNLIQITADASALAPGDYSGTVTVNSNAANGPQTIPYQLEVVAAGPPLVSAGGVVNNATFAGNDELGRGVIAAVFGEQLIMKDPVQASKLPLETTLGGVSVLVNGQRAPVYFVSYNQINFQVPYDVAEGMATVSVERDGQRSNLASVRIVDRAPRILVFGNYPGYGIIVNQDGTYPLPASAGLGSAARPARTGDVLVMYALGLGPTNPVVVSGAGAPTSPLAVVTPTPGVTFGANAVPGLDSVTPDFVGLTPNFVGLYQINVRVPASAPRGDAVPVYLNFGSKLSNQVKLAIQ